MYCKYYTIHLQRLQRYYFLRLLYGNFASYKYDGNGYKEEKGAGKINLFKTAKYYTAGACRPRGSITRYHR